ncbi:MAG: tape measure protein [Evtepia gabavorous]|mgnify:FL=1|uniref:tape measure protein n=1 Tax=Evtepia gabavorous TaxID=2211183 RepID=UPI002E761E43|nr:tape measure protein [Evtepia gabavorous]MEE0067413.1 tape measure protein [Evtepia gabavorous]
MATIRSQMVLNDQVTGVLKNITRALDITLHSFEQMQDASANAVDVRLLNQARAGLGEVNLAVREMEENYRRAAQQEQQVTRNIRQSTQAEQQLNASIRGGNDALDDMVGKAKNLAATIGASVGLKKLIELSDQMTSTTARLNFIVDDGGSVKALEAKIMASAQRSRAAYLDTASAIASMGANAGAAFTSNDELIAFMEQVNKQFVIGGASAQGQAAAMLQLTQAMAAGALRGEELNSILENAPGIARAIEQYMGIAEGSIKSYAEKGAVSATVVKNALLSIADETNAKFNGMAMTWGQVWTQMGNIALKVTQPLLTAINWLANNLSVIGPILLGLGTAFLVFQVAAHWTQIAAVATAAYHAVVNLLSIGFGVLTGNTAAASAAVFTFNSALLASPITWIIMLIAVVIGLLYGVVAIINKVTGSSISATGLICGAIAVAGAFIGNTVIGLLNALIQYIWAIFVAPFLGIVEWILNVCNGGFNSFGDAVANLIGQIIGWFLNLGKVVTTIIDAIFGTNWTAGLESLQSSVTAWGKNENAITLDKNAPTVDYRFEYGDAWAAGNDFGKGIDAKIGGMFNTGGLGDSSGFDLGDIAAYTGETADNTGKTADALAVTEEQLEYLRDIAERDAINRFTTAEVKIDMTGMTNRIDGSADLDGVISQLTEGFTEALVTAAEGVHA